MKPRILLILLILVTGTILLAGCTGTHSSSSDQGASWNAPAKDIVTTSESYTKVQGSTRIGYSGSTAPVPGAASASRAGTGSQDADAKIIKTAYISLEVKDVPGSLENLKSLAADNGGYLTSTNVQKSSNNRLSGTAVLRIPQDKFDTILIGIKALGTVTSASTQAQDVTEEYVDLVAQKTSYQNQLAQYNTIMKQSTKVEDIIKVQEQIDRVQTELDRLEGRLKYLNSRVDLSTITVNVQEPEPVGGNSGYSIVSVINDGIAGFFGMIAGIIVLLLTLLPLIIIGVAGYGIYRWHRGRKPGQGADADSVKK